MVIFKTHSIQVSDVILIKTNTTLDIGKTTNMMDKVKYLRLKENSSSVDSSLKINSFKNNKNVILYFLLIGKHSSRISIEKYKAIHSSLRINP